MDANKLITLHRALCIEQLPFMLDQYLGHHCNRIYLRLISLSRLGKLKNMVHVTPVDSDMELVARIPVDAGNVREMSGIVHYVRLAVQQCCFRHILQQVVGISSTYCNSVKYRTSHKTLKGDARG